MKPCNCGLRIADCGLQNRRILLLALFVALPITTGGCRQKMADQPYYRPLDEAEFFPDKRASRPIERGTVHRGQYLDRDPIATGLTPEEWERADKLAIPPKPEAGKEPQTLSEDERRQHAIGAPRFDQSKSGQPKVYVEEFPFPITQADLKIGETRYTAYCAVCHGPLGNGQGKIWERGFLDPTSFHTKKVDPKEANKEPDERRGISRGYLLWGHNLPMDQVPVGYYFEVITKGYGGMPSYSAQVSPEDRWRIIAWIRVLQNTQKADAVKVKQATEAGGKK